MCGISGIIYKHNAGELTKDISNKILASLNHRGPDEHGWFTCNDTGQISLGKDPIDSARVKVALFHMRLSILDLSEHGWQPMLSADKRYAMVFNGEIYNYLELKQELQKLGYTFHTNTDSEVLLNAYIAWGEKALVRFEGMFVFVIFDIINKTLFLARDFFGIKPLYFVECPDRIIFASEAKTLLLFQDVPRKLNPQLVYDYLQFGITDHGQETMIESIKQLPASHYIKTSLIKDRNKPSFYPIRYWKMATNKEHHKLNFTDAADQVRHIFLQNIRHHMRSDVTIGAALSGGIDSSAIVSAMRYLEPDMDINTFSYIADSENLSEEKWVDIVNNTVKANSHKIRISSSELIKDLDDLIKTQDFPFGSTSIYAQYRIFKQARESGVKVMLDGQGGDEIFAGYRSYLSAYLASLCRNLNFAEAIKLTINTKRYLGYSLIKLIAMTTSNFFGLTGQHFLRMLINKELKPVWINQKWLQDNRVTPIIFGSTKEKNTLREYLRKAIEEHGLIHLLRYEDRNSMRFSIESRVPFLTIGLVNFVGSLPENYLIDSKANQKAVFKKAMQGIVPNQILKRSDKIGFATPEQKWLRETTHWINDFITNVEIQDNAIFKFHLLKQHWDAVFRGDQPFTSGIWRIINFIKWAKHLNIPLQ